MENFKAFIELINENTGLTLILSGLGYFVNDLWKRRNAKKRRKYDSRQSYIDNQSHDQEGELFNILTTFHLTAQHTEKMCADKSDEIRTYIIDNDLFLDDKLCKIASKYADYILESLENGKDVKKEKKMLKEYKKVFRS